MLRVGDLERSLRFYTEVLACACSARLSGGQIHPWLSSVYGDETDTADDRADYNWGVDKYELATPSATSPWPWTTLTRLARK